MKIYEDADRKFIKDSDGEGAETPEYVDESYVSIENDYKAANSISNIARVAFLITSALSNMSFFYHLTSVNTLQGQIENKNNIDISESQFGLLTTLIAAPSTIIPVFLGTLIDKVGARISLIFGCAFLLLGELLFFIGGTNKSYVLMCIGSLVLGIGTDAAQIAKSKIIQKWFKGKGFAFAVGLGAAMIAFCNIFASIMGPVFYDMHNSLFVPLLLQLLLSLFCLIMAIIAAIIDKSHESIFEKYNVKEKIDKLSLDGIKQMPSMFWLVCLAGVFGYGSYTVGNIVTSKLCQVRFGFSPKDAGLLRSIPQLGVVTLPPLLGYYSDRKGQRITLLIIGYLVIAVALILNATLPNCIECYTVVIPFVLEGFFIAIFGVIFYPTIGLLVKTENVGLAIGIFSWMFGVFCAIMAPVDGWLIQLTSDGEKHGYSLVFWYLSIFPVVSIVLMSLALRKDKQTGRHINGSPKHS